MATDIIMDDDKDFLVFQRNWYKQLKKFMDGGDQMQKHLKEEGATAPTEVLMFLLFWEMVTFKYLKQRDLEFIKHMFIKIMDKGAFNKFLEENEMSDKVQLPKRPTKTTVH
jgi:hypothetical protein